KRTADGVYCPFLIDKRDHHRAALPQCILVKIYLVVGQSTLKFCLERLACGNSRYRSTRTENCSAKNSARNYRAHARNQQAGGGGTQTRASGYPYGSAYGATHCCAHPWLFGVVSGYCPLDLLVAHTRRQQRNSIVGNSQGINLSDSLFRCGT